MKNTIPEVDEYIENAAEFAQPILTRLRKAFHDACPELREEIKWGIPYFCRNGLVAGMAAFQSHVSFGFWRSREMDDPEELFDRGPKASMCNVRIQSTKDIPAKKVLTAYVKQAVALDDTPKKAASKATKKPAPKAPADLMAALKKNKKALATYEGFPPSKKRDYVDWITEAKREATREKRLAQAVEWMAEGKSRNWKYEKC